MDHHICVNPGSDKTLIVINKLYLNANNHPLS